MFSHPLLHFPPNFLNIVRERICDVYLKSYEWQVGVGGQLEVYCLKSGNDF